MAVRCVRALQRCDAPEDPRPVPPRLRQVMAVRCVRAGKSTQAPAAPTLVRLSLKLVMHVLSDSARASTRHPASLKLNLLFISNLVRAGSLELMRCSSCGGRSGCASVALLPKAEAAAGKPKGAAEDIGWPGFTAELAAGRAAEDTPKGLVKAAVPKGAFVGAAPKTGAAPGAA